LARAYDMEPGPVAGAVHFSLDEVFLEEDIVVVVVCVRGCGVNIDGGYLGRESGECGSCTGWSLLLRVYLSLVSSKWGLLT
jgi:hypothetical protein